jgi:hypothetical protein
MIGNPSLRYYLMTIRGSWIDRIIWTEIKFRLRIGEFSKNNIRKSLKKRRLENPCSMMRKTMDMRTNKQQISD